MQTAAPAAVRILMIILDEADAFFKGRKTAQEAAQVMDRRAALFIAEAG